MIVKARFFCLLTLLSALLVPSLFAVTPTKDLYYFVIDRSESIDSKKLVEPFRKAVVEFVGKLDAETQVDIVFFSTTSTRPRSWYPMDLRAKGEFGKYFDDNFRPGGNTLLFATVADVLSRVLAKEKEFRNINIVILSDGEDNLSSKADPKFEKWGDVERLLPENWAKQRKGLSVIWAPIEFDPPQKDRPSKDSFIQMLPRLNRSEIERVFTPPPRASFTANPTKVKVGEPVLFALYDDTGVSSVKWAFGDGTELSKKTASHQYSAKGNYDVSVEAMGPGGKAKADMKGYVQVVEDIPPEARFSWHPALIRVGDDVKFTDESLGAPTKWEWGFEGLGAKKDRNPTVVFTKPGKVRVSLAVAQEGASHSVQQELDVLPMPPDPSFTAEPSELELGQVLHLKATPTADELTHTWVIGGGITKTGAEANWTADKLGRIEVQHTVKGPGGIVDKDFAVFVKEKPSALVARFKWSPEDVRAGAPIQLVDESRGAPEKWLWEIDNVGTYPDQSPSIKFPHAGSYTVKLTIFKKDQTIDTQKTVEVRPAIVAVTANFVAKPPRGVVPVTVQFEDKSVGHISKWSWEFGDGSTSDLRNPVYTFKNVGSFRPRLTVIDIDGRSSKSSGDFVISAVSPQPWWLKWVVGGAIVVLGWLFVVVPLMTAGARRKAASMTLDLGHGDARTLSECLPG
ncbi:MAG: PKD domain-containing protein, partial [bacterium]